MSELWLGHARLKRHPPADALAAILLPEDVDARAGAHHRLVWTLFDDAPDRRRDFLWRDTNSGSLGAEGGSFLTLSARQPRGRLGLFELECKPFAPALAPGDRLAFALCANPVITRRDPATGRPPRRDVVMDKLHAIPKGRRAERRLGRWARPAANGPRRRASGRASGCRARSGSTATTRCGSAAVAAETR